MRDGFGTYHPLANLIYFLSVMVCAMVINDPIFTVISAVGSVAFAVQLKGEKAAFVVLKAALPMMIFMAVLNPLFNHGGVTPLFRLPSGNAFTLEALIFGLKAGATLGAMFLWCYSMNFILTGDKLIYIFGRISPYFGLAVSLVMGFIPVFKDKYKMAYNAQKQFGGSRFAVSGRCVLAALGAVIEESADTAESMVSRGFGLKGRTAFTPYKIESKDKMFIAVNGLLLAMVIVLFASGAFDYFYYPKVKSYGNEFRFLGAAAYMIMCLLPTFIYLKEMRRMK